MSFAAEINDFLGGFQAGYKMRDGAKNRKAQADRDKSNDAYRRGYEDPDQMDRAKEMREKSKGTPGGVERPRARAIPAGDKSAQIEGAANSGDPSADHVLDFIRQHEGGANGYNSLVYKRDGTPGGSADLTNMSVGEVMKFQQSMPDQGHASTAVGGYQIVAPTLQGLVQKYQIDPNEKFTPEMQDRLALNLMKERGWDKYKADPTPATQQKFMHNLSQEWAFLPKDESGASFYEGQNGNKAGVGWGDFASVISGSGKAGAERTAKAIPATDAEPDDSGFSAPERKSLEDQGIVQAQDPEPLPTDDPYAPDPEDEVEPYQAFAEGGVVDKYNPNRVSTQAIPTGTAQQPGAAGTGFVPRRVGQAPAGGGTDPNYNPSAGAKAKFDAMIAAQKERLAQQQAAPAAPAYNPQDFDHQGYIEAQMKWNADQSHLARSREQANLSRASKDERRAGLFSNGQAKPQYAVQAQPFMDEARWQRTQPGYSDWYETAYGRPPPQGGTVINGQRYYTTQGHAEGGIVRALPVKGYAEGGVVEKEDPIEVGEFVPPTRYREMDPGGGPINEGTAAQWRLDAGRSKHKAALEERAKKYDAAPKPKPVKEPKKDPERKAESEDKPTNRQTEIAGGDRRMEPRDIGPQTPPEAQYDANGNVTVPAVGAPPPAGTPQAIPTDAAVPQANAAPPPAYAPGGSAPPSLDPSMNPALNNGPAALAAAQAAPTALPTSPIPEGQGPTAAADAAPPPPTALPTSQAAIPRTANPENPPPNGAVRPEPAAPEADAEGPGEDPSPSKPKGEGRKAKPIVDSEKPVPTAQIVTRGDVQPAVAAGAKVINDALAAEKTQAITPQGGGKPSVSLASNQGAMPQADYEKMLKTVDPEGKLEPAQRLMKALTDQYDWYMSEGLPDKAQQVAASMLMTSRRISQLSGSMAGAALEQGDLKAAADWMANAYEHMPDGKELRVGEVGQEGGQPAIRYQIVDLETGKVEADDYATAEEMGGLAKQMMSGTAFAREVIGIASGAGVGRRSRGGARTARGPTASEERMTEGAGIIDQMNTLGRQFKAEQDPEKRAALKSQYDELAGTYMKTRQTPGPLTTMSKMYGMDPPRQTAAGQRDAQAGEANKQRRAKLDQDIAAATDPKEKARLTNDAKMLDMDEAFDAADRSTKGVVPVNAIQKRVEALSQDAATQTEVLDADLQNRVQNAAMILAKGNYEMGAGIVDPIVQAFQGAKIKPADGGRVLIGDFPQPIFVNGQVLRSIFQYRKKMDAPEAGG